MEQTTSPFSAGLISRAFLWCVRVCTSAASTPRSIELPRRIFRKAVMLPAAILMLCAGITPVHAADDYYYCMVWERVIGFREEPTPYYFSAIFSAERATFYGDPRIDVDYGHPFRDYVEQQYNVDATWNIVGDGHICMGYSSSYQEVKNEYDDKVRRHSNARIATRDLYTVVQTNWSPDDFTNQPLRDFNITVSSGQQEVRVCVRDHECEDGDEVRVSVNGEVLFSGEIDNQWACSDVAVRKGNNRIEMYAINGTGHKGAHCSHRNVNTGEIQVGGENVQTQSWRHRGGAGSSANIVVEID